MSSIDSWQMMMMKNLRSQGRKSRAAVSDQYNMALGSSGAMSGAGRSATEGIAAQEAVDASGINAMAADMNAERMAAQKETENIRKDAKKAAWIQGISNVVGAVAPGVIGGAAKIAGNIFGGNKQAGQPAQAVMGQQGIPTAAPSMQGAVTGGLQSSGLYDFFVRRAGKRKQFPQYPNIYDQFDTSRRY